MTPRWIVGFLTLVVLACRGEGAGPDAPDNAATDGTILSSPVPRTALGETGSGSLVFVAVEPASVAGAASAIVRGPRGDSAVALVQGGGFDPLPIPGAIGDMISLSIVDSGGRVAERHVMTKQRPTRVVRTSPAPRRTDVPLNTRIAVVFSAPVDPATATSGVSLWQNGVQVPGETHLTPDALAAEFTPGVLLQASTDYELRVDSSVRDVLGAPIAESATIPFRTAAATAPIGVLSIVGHEYPWLNRAVNPIRLQVGQSVDLYASTGGLQVVDGAPTRWTSSNPSVLRVTERSPGFATETGMSPGRATVQVESEGRTARLIVDVIGFVRPTNMATALVYVDRYTSLWRQRANGADAVQLMAISELPEDPTLCADGPITNFADCYWTPHRFAIGPNERIAVTRASDIGGVWVKEGVGAALRQVNSAAERGAAHSPAWSPSGDKLAYWFDFYADAETELRVVNLDGTDERILSRVPYDTNSAPPGTDPMWASRPPGGAPFVWHPDGTRLLVAAAEGTVQTRIDGTGTSPYLSGYQPGPWFPDGQTQFVFQVPVRMLEPLPYRVFRATALGVIDAEGGFSAPAPPVAVSSDGLLMADWAFVFNLNRTASIEVTSYAGMWQIVGFAP